MPHLLLYVFFNPQRSSLTLGNAEECEIHSLVLRHAVANSLSTVSHKLRRCRCAFPVDGLRVSALRRIGGVLRRCEAEDVGPFLKLLLVYTQSQ